MPNLDGLTEDELKQLRGLGQGQVPGVVEKIVAAREARSRQKLASVWSQLIDYMLEDTMEDGTPVLELVLKFNPSLNKELGDLLGNRL